MQFYFYFTDTKFYICNVTLFVTYFLQFIISYNIMSQD